jgi:hypothetical protein
MSHPKNKRERFLSGDKKGKKRTDNYLKELAVLPNVDKAFCNKAKAKRRDTTKLCSCAMCGNPRKFFDEKTMQEKRLEDVDTD